MLDLVVYKWFTLSQVTSFTERHISIQTNLSKKRLKVE